MSENTTKTFTITDDLGTFTFKRTEKGYCTMNGKRVSAKVFEQAERLHKEQVIAEIDANVEAAKETAAKVEGGIPEGIDPAEFDAWVAGQPADKWDEEDAATEVTAEVPERVTGNTEEVYADEPVPAKPEFDIPGVRKDQASVGHVNGHEYVHDWFGKRYFRDGEEITKFEYEHEVHGVEAPKPAKPKAKRTRKPKDVAGTYETSEGTVTLTLKQKCFLTDLSHLGEDELLGNVHGGVWCDVLCDQIGGQFAGKPMSVGAMLSTICEKGLGERHRERREDGTGTGRGKLVTVFRLTRKGEEVWEGMGL